MNNPPGKEDIRVCGCGVLLDRTGPTSWVHSEDSECAIPEPYWWGVEWDILSEVQQRYAGDGYRWRVRSY